MIAEKTLPINAFIVALDETHNYHIIDGHESAIESIVSVYFFDRNQITHCCEFTPSYFLIHLYDEVRLTQEGDELSDAAKDELYETYENCGGDDIYVHCHTIDKLIKARKKDRKGKVSHYGRPSGPQYRGETYDEKMERLRDYLQGNHQL